MSETPPLGTYLHYRIEALQARMLGQRPPDLRGPATDNSVDPLDSDSLADESGQATHPGQNVLDKADKALENLLEKALDKALENSPPEFSFRRDGLELAKRLASVHLGMILAFFGLMSVYWGALYHRELRVGNMRMLVAVADDGVQLANGTEAGSLLADALGNLFAQLAQRGRFETANMTALAAEAAAANSSLFDVVCSKVHRQKYWAAFYVNATASQTVYDSLVLNSTDALAPLYLVLAVYESGRHYLALSQYVTKNVRILASQWLQLYAGQQYAYAVRHWLTQAQRAAYLDRAAAGAALVLPAFNLVDLRPASLPAVLGPSELGLVYSMIFSFHQFNFSADLHNMIGERLRFRHYLCYRVVFSQVNHLILSFVYALMTLAFQVSVTVAYGHSGFVVLWCTMFLFISALGGLNEIVVTCINTWGTKAFIAPWIIFTIVSNISPAFAPLVLSPGFYRYGYAMPMFNAYEALRVVFFNTWRGGLGRNYGVLAAWVVATNIVLCFVLKIVNDRKKREAITKRADAEKKCAATNSQH